MYLSAEGKFLWESRNDLQEIRDSYAAAITGETAEPEAAIREETAATEETVETTATVPEETTIPAVTERATADQAEQAGKAAVPEQAVNRMAAIPVKIPIKTELPERIL